MPLRFSIWHIWAIVRGRDWSAVNDVRVTTCSSCFGQNEGRYVEWSTVQFYVNRNGLKDADWFELETAMSYFGFCEKMRFWKIVIKNCFPKFCFLSCQKKRNKCGENTCRWMFVPNLKPVSWNATEFCPVNVKEAIFHAIPGISSFYIFLFPDLDLLKSVLGYFFTSFKDICPKSMAPPGPKTLYFDLLWPRDIGWPWLDNRSPKDYDSTYKYPR